MIEANVRSGTDEVNDQIIENQERFINKIVEDIVKQAKENLYTLINSGKVNDAIDIYNNQWNYTLAKAAVNIAVKNINKEWPTNCHFNNKCKRYEDIIKGEK